ncbi:MAG TPA: TauD/TfdA family dioxygenase [Burkholderiales bacterium]|jgi:hypothetical protein
MAESILGPITTIDAWSGASLRGTQSWITHLSSAEIADIDHALSHAKTLNRDLFTLTRDDFPMPLMANRFAATRGELEGGRGFTLLRGLPIARYSVEEARLLFWGLSLHLGEPQEQDGAGNRMHNVTNTGMRVEKTNNVRSFQTDDELTFHCDGGDAFMLLCMKTAKSGGISKLVSAAHLYNEILRRRPDLIDVLQQPFHFDTRGQHLSGTRFQSVPIFNVFQGRLSMLYKRRYLRTAQEYPEVPKFTRGQQEAIDLIETLTNDPDVQLTFYMEPGDLQLANNYAVLHARSKYEDFDEPERRRHLLRAWVTLPNGRALPPAFAATREFGTSYARRHGAPAQAA